MNTLSFLQTLTNPSFLHNYHSLVVSSKSDYPLLLLSLVMQQLKKHNTLTVETIDLIQNDLGIVQSRLASSFLGSKVFYWLGNISALDAKKKKQWLAYVANYTGPNIIGYYVTTDLVPAKNNHMQHVSFDHKVDEALLTTLIKLQFGSVSERVRKIVRAICAKKITVSLDTACLLVHYCTMANGGSNEFLTEWLELLVQSDSSLFVLSQNFFGKKSQLFLSQWQMLKYKYSEMFWIAFWSEQLWRASHYITFSKHNNFTRARKIGFRLPFSFLQRDWKQISTKELRQAHNFLYGIDHSLKNSGQPFVLDLFYSKFLSGQFNTTA